MNIFEIIKQNISISTIIGEYTTLRKAGVYLKGRCPFHHERTASFTVSPHKDIFYCFGCHVGGDVISFIAKIERFSQIEAAHYLAKQNNITLPEEFCIENFQKQEDEKQRYIKACTVFAQWAHTTLKNQKQIKEYLEHRGISTISITKFLIGYCSTGSLSIKSLLYYAQQQGIMAKDFIEAHILLQNNNSNALYSPFEDRILFPIKDAQGNICGFGGRIYKPHDTRPKYYNSHEHQHFNKKSLLYNLDLAKKNIQQQENAFLVEGYTDVIAMDHYKYANTIATLGTSCGYDHLKLLSRYTQKLYILFDGDEAGQKAIVRLAEYCFQASIDLYVIRLPEKEDPASYLAKNKTLDPLIKSAQDIFVFYIEKLGTHFNQKNTQERVALLQEFLSLITKVHDPLRQDVLLQKASLVFNIPFETLQRELKKCRFSKRLPKDKDGDILKDSKETPISILIKSITPLEKKIFFSILQPHDYSLTEPDTKLLYSFITEPFKGLFNAIVKAQLTYPQNKLDIDNFSDDHKQLVTYFIINLEEGSTTDLEELLSQFQKKQWKILVHNVKLRIEYAQKQKDSDTIIKLLAYLENVKKKMLDKGLI